MSLVLKLVFGYLHLQNIPDLRKRLRNRNEINGGSYSDILAFARTDIVIRFTYVICPQVRIAFTAWDVSYHVPLC